MTDFFAFELEDNFWDEFDESDDHRVPHPVDDARDLCAFQSDSRKKPRKEVVGVTSDSDNASKFFIQGKHEQSLQKPILGKDSWSHRRDGGHSVSCSGDTAKDMRPITSNDIRISNQGFEFGIDSGNEFCSDNTILDDGSAAIGTSSYRLAPCHTSQTEDNIDFFNNDHDNEEINDLLYYGWPDARGFEDVDAMLRSCDSSFGLEGLTNEDDLCWISSLRTRKGCDNAMKSGFNRSSESNVQKIGSESLDASGPSNAGLSINDCYKKSSTTSECSIARTMESDAVTKEETNLHEKHQQHKNQSKVERKEKCPCSGAFFDCHESLECFVGTKHNLGHLSPDDFSSAGIQQHKHSVAPHSLAPVEADKSHMNLKICDPSQHISDFPILSSAPSEGCCHQPPSEKNSFYASNQFLSIDGAQSPSSNSPMSKDGKRKKLRHHQSIVKSTEFYDQGWHREPVFHYENEIEGHNAVEGATKCSPAELHSANTQAMSFRGSVCDETSLEASSLRQLQQVMEKLDIATKLCIRDSLYRLSRTAEKRHDCENQNGDVRRETEGNRALMAEETHKCAGCMNMETNTNPVDRSVAHLLFHRPSDQSVSGNDVLSSKFPVMKKIHASVTSPAMVPELQVCQEQTSNDASICADE